VRRRFFLQQFDGESAVMEGQAAHHLGHVLRAEPGQLYELSDGQRVWLGRIESVTHDRVQFTLVEELPASPPGVDVTVLLAVVKFDAFELALEKATELGVGTIIPLAAARSEKGLVAAAAKRSERWRKILHSASEQSRRVRLPTLAELSKPESAFASQQSGLRVMLSERSKALPLRTILHDQVPAPATLAIGPEGGWTDSEFEAAQSTGFLEASLGRLILRTETAVIAALASLNYALGRD
jgi:16S rRNA (uracil1498-N3)-methyltransferase